MPGKLWNKARDRFKGRKAIQTNDPRITLMAGGYPLFANGKIAGGISVGGGTQEQDCAIAEYVVSVFEDALKG